MFGSTTDLLEQARAASRAEQKDFRSAESGIAHRLYLLRREFQQADAVCARGADIVPECAGDVDTLELIERSAPALQQNTQAGRNGAFGQLEFSNIRLRDRDRGAEIHLLSSVGKSAGRQNPAKLERGGHCIHQSTSANPARLPPTQHVALESIASHDYA